MDVGDQRLIVTVGQACGISRAWADNHCLSADEAEDCARRWYKRTQGPNAKTWARLARCLESTLGARKN